MFRSRLVCHVASETISSNPITLLSDRFGMFPNPAPGNQGGHVTSWSPEALLVGSAGEFFHESFRNLATAYGFAWETLQCELTGVLEVIAGSLKVRRLEIRARLHIPAGAGIDTARKLLQSAEDNYIATQPYVTEVWVESHVRECTSTPAMNDSYSALGA